VVVPLANVIVTVFATEADPLYVNVMACDGLVHDAGETVTFASLDESAIGAANVADAGIAFPPASDVVAATVAVAGTPRAKAFPTV
jgi:hypothetical protein